MTRVASALLCLLVATADARAWHDEGHIYVSHAAVAVLPDDVPPFFREAAEAIAHGSIDPDVIQNDGLPQVRAANGPEHYIDLEYLRGKPLPKDRYAYIALLHEHGVKPQHAGMVPYAVAEYTQRLTMAFAEYRHNPDSEHIQNKCKVIAGELAHYTADLHMPLHTTIHFNGRVKLTADGKPDTDAPKVHEGIHIKVDALPTKLPYNVIFKLPIDSPEPADDLMAFIIKNLQASHALVDRTYELVDGIPGVADLEIKDEAVKAYTIERTRAAAQFTSSIFLTAWRDSAKIELPFWLDRATFEDGFDRDQVPPQPPRKSRED